MRNTGLEGAFINLFPNRANFDMDYGKAERIFERILDAAEAAGFKVALYDENYRNDLIANAARDIAFLSQHIHRPGYYQINGQPAIWIQNFNEHLYSPDQLRELIRYIQSKLNTDLYWVVSLFRFNRAVTEKRKSYLEIEEIDCVDFRYAVEEIAKNQQTGEISWFAMKEGLRDFVEALRGSTVKHDWSASVSPGFDTIVDYTRASDVITDGYVMPYQRRDGGLTLLKELHLLSQQDPPPAFVTIKSWNDYHEGHGIEPGFYYEGDETEPLGQNQDPYFYTKLIAETVGTQFIPAQLPPLEELDPLMRPRFSRLDDRCDSYGPLFVEKRFDNGGFFCRLADFRNSDCKLIWDQKPVAGFRVNRGEVEQWGLQVHSGGVASGAIHVKEVEGNWGLTSSDSESSLSISLAEDVCQQLRDESRVFLVFSFFDHVSNSRQFENLRVDYPARSPVKMQDRRTRIFNSWTWEWMIRQLHGAWFEEEKDVKLSVDSGELLLHALYVVIPGLSRSEKLVEPVGDNEYVFRAERQPIGDPVHILYSQDADGNYGNLLLVDFERLRVIPNVKSVVTR